jgi:histone H3/H4
MICQAKNRHFYSIALPYSNLHTTQLKAVFGHYLAAMMSVLCKWAEHAKRKCLTE